jgi:hypothetical protein
MFYDVPQNKLPRGCSFTFLTNFSEQLLSNFRILKGQKVLNSGMKLNRNSIQKWSPMVPSPLNLKWKDVWLKTRVKKDVSSRYNYVAHLGWQENHKTFNNVNWNDIRLANPIWEQPIDYGKFHCNRVLLQIMKFPP